MLGRAGAAVSAHGRKTPVSVVIGGEEYKLRADATPDYALECADYVDRALEEVLRQGAIVEGRKAAILAALSLTDQLFQARAELARLREEVARHSSKLATDVEAAMAAGGLASSR